VNAIRNYEFYYKLRTLPFVQAIWLYGSRAKGSSAAQSDIDIAIVCPQASQEEWLKIRNIIDNADTLFEIDCIHFDTLEDERLKQTILKEKQILFERKPNNFPWYEVFLDLGEAIDKLGEILSKPSTDTAYVKEATIQRFKISVELFWKLLKKICQSEGAETTSPKSTLQKSFSIKLIEDEEAWLDMLEDRNLTSHTYHQPLANRIYSHCTKYYAIMDKTYQNLKRLYDL